MQHSFNASQVQKLKLFNKAEDVSKYRKISMARSYSANKKVKQN